MEDNGEASIPSASGLAKCKACGTEVLEVGLLRHILHPRNVNDCKSVYGAESLLANKLKNNKKKNMGRGWSHQETKYKEILVVRSFRFWSDFLLGSRSWFSFGRSRSGF